MGEIVRNNRLPLKAYTLIVLSLMMLLSGATAQGQRNRSRQARRTQNNDDNDGETSNDNNSRNQMIDPEKEDDANDTSRPPMLTTKEQNELSKQWHPPGHASPISPAYAGYRGPDRAMLRPEEATLSLEIFPLYYTPITRSSSFRLNFSSNVMRKRDINFEVYYSLSRYINFHFHPTKIQLKLWNNVYWIKYSKPVVVDEFDVMRSLEYSEAEIKNLFKEMPIINTKQQNMIFLDPQRRYSFSAYNVKKIAETKGRVECFSKIRRVRGYKLLKKLMEERKRRKQKQLDQQEKMMNQSSDDANRNRQQRVRKLVVNSPRKLKTTKFVKDNYNDLNIEDDFSKKTLLEEMKDGRRAMLLLYGKKFIREIIIVCEIK